MDSRAAPPPPSPSPAFLALLPSAAKLGAAVGPLSAAWAMLSATVYAVAAWQATGEPAFPVDDAWIHQTLARSLVQSGAFAVNPGEPVAGSTAPLWTVLMAAGHLLHLPPVLWASVTGAACFAGVLLATHALARTLFPQQPLAAAAAAAFTALDWRLAWAAASGMETALFIALSLLILYLGAAPRTPLPLLGAVGALAALTRPEGAVLFAGALGARLLAAPGRGLWLRDLPLTGIVFATVLLPAAGYHWAVFGNPLPATFFAKGAFYREPVTAGLVIRYGSEVVQFLFASPLLILVPAALLGAARWGTRRAVPPLAHLLAAGWLLLLPLMYLLWLPYLYHHGRYLFPILPLVYIFGTAGALQLAPRLALRPLGKTMSVLAAGMALGLWAYGAVSFTYDARFIRQQQIAVARWLAASTPAEAVVATHDVGALGYMSGRRIIDMAGLVTPALTATPKDRERILQVMQHEGVGYVALLPGWYPWFPGELAAQEVFKTRLVHANRDLGVGFRVYRVDWP